MEDSLRNTDGVAEARYGKSSVLYSMEDVQKIVQAQQKTITRLTAELTKKSQAVPRAIYEEALNNLESEKYEHAKLKLELLDANDKIEAQANEIAYYKSELEKERCAYNNVFELLKDKALNEGTKSIDLISKIAENEVRYNDALADIAAKERKFAQLCGQIKQKEQSFEHKVEELNLKVEQDKYIAKMLNLQASSVNHRTSAKTTRNNGLNMAISK